MANIFRRWVQDIYSGLTNPTFRNLWASNFQLLVKLIRDGRDSIWAYILKNLSRPWCWRKRALTSSSAIRPGFPTAISIAPFGKTKLRHLYIYYQLIDSGDVKLFTQMDLSTLFFAHAKDRYLKDDGTLAFVMPRSVLTGAKQHRPFQRQGMTRILDVGDVSPLFNVPAAVIISSGGDIAKADIPTNLPGDFRQTRIAAAPKPSLCKCTCSARRHKFRRPEIASIYYYELFAQGASLVPRNLCFVRPPGLPNTPIVATDPELDKDAKAPWKGIKAEGTVHSPYIYGTLLSKHLLPFGWQKLNMVALPAKRNDKGKLEILEDVLAFAVTAHHRSFTTWFEKMSDIWEERKKKRLTSHYRKDMIITNCSQAQIVTDRFRVLYGGSGTNIACCVLGYSIMRS